jgi:quinolinate synthase
MKVTTLPKVLASLQRMQYRITVPDEIAARARLAIERMVSIGAGGPVQVGTQAGPGADPGE